MAVANQNLRSVLQAKIDAVVMTVPQAKGLEFNDVFILNFFADSPCKEEWRILLQVGAATRG